MKRQLLTLFSLILIITACSKNESSPTNENKVSLGNDSLVNRLKLKPSDKQGLSIKSQLFKDSKGAYLVVGEKNQKYWLGYFDRSGNELSTKTFDDDPTEIKGPYGTTIKLNSINYFDIIEVNGTIYLNKQLRDGNAQVDHTPFVESLIRINTNARAITNEYTEVKFDEKSTYTPFIGPWFNNTVIISKTSLGLPNGNSSTTNDIYSADNMLVVSYKGSFFSKKNRNYVPLSMTEFLDLNEPRFVIKRDISNLEKPIFGAYLFPSLVESDRITIKKQVVENNILTVEAEVLSYNGDKKSLTSKLDVRTGKLLN
ncbi:hypothetical protein SAMN05421820_104360 [Pedobacter steynii]|uniref:Lipoprotein n=1 Tax=Pedobacter steynii TaxID=430522 RepID=A0A1G9V299_9SPHI|nr:hypothetical protein [Pedobacter steynii]NQX40955.1 hypothetical protein [Pedobacter steynii]SDM66167.1 hypothetical protein SAMN05421820_104360 [Pedobacter steynii]